LSLSKFQVNLAFKILKSLAKPDGSLIYSQNL
jgi:hypothetical protein